MTRRTFCLFAIGFAMGFMSECDGNDDDEEGNL